MKLYQKILASILFISTFVIIGLFKNLPSGKLWDNYSILYVDKETSDSLVVQSLLENGINDYISLNNQFLPVRFNTFSPEVSYFKSNSDNPAFSYIKNRNAYFFDKSNNYRLYYIPSEYKNKLGKVVEKLNEYNKFCGLDSSLSYPYILPLLICLIFILLAIFSREKLLFIAASLQSLLFIFCNPFYQLGIAIIINLLIFFIISNLWRRKGAFKRLSKIYLLGILLILGIISSFACGIKIALIYLLLLISGGASLLLYSQIENYFREKKSFVPIYILSAKRTSMFANKSKFVLSSCLIISSLLILFFFLSTFTNFSSSSKKVSLPAATRKSQSQLPNLEDYYQWHWNIEAGPYLSLNKKQDNNMISFPRYKKEGKKLVEYQETLTFDQDYKNKLYSEIDDFKYLSLEKMLKSQGKDFAGGYKSTSSYKISIFGITILLISYLILLFFSISIIIKKGQRK
ncbi:MAG: hypothetical protein K5866_01145 [Treponema sp.]|nr:hypothetical protein [Treponema sp.]